MKSRFVLSMFLILFLIQGCYKENQQIYLNIDPWVEYGSVSDKDGNTYKTILIGTQTWMVRNLRTTKYNDGTPIPVVNDPDLWYSLSEPACCWLNNDPVRKVTYGILYNWHAVNSGRLCPTGWHVPDDSEWTVLTNFLGGENIAGGKMKESGVTHWFSPNTGATNEIHFFALPGGLRLNDQGAKYEDLGEAGYWWSTTSGAEWASIRSLRYDSFRIERQFYSKNSGLSVRCIRDY